MANINELSRIEHSQIISEHTYWALYHGIYELFTKIDTREELLKKYKMMLKIMKPGKGRGALTFFYRIRRDEIDNIINWEPGVEVVLVNEFERQGNPYQKLRVGSHQHAKTNTNAWKVLQFIDSFGKEGVGLTQIQKYIWVELNGNSVESFYKPSKGKYYHDKFGKLQWDKNAITGRATRGYWNSNLYGTGYQEGVLHKFCKRTGNGKWRLVRWPEYNENLMV